MARILRCAAALLLTSAIAYAHAPPPRILFGYFENWAGYSAEDLEKSGAAAKLTHLAYAFANVRSGTCSYSDPAADAVKLAALDAVRRRHPQLKILISVGGASSANNAAFSAAAKSKEGRARLAESCVNLFTQSSGFKFDGIDLDWEYPTAADKSNFTALLAEFRSRLEGRYLLTVAAPAGKQNYSQIELAQVAAQLDFINLMTYDYTGTWSSQTGHASSLSSVSATVKDYEDAGVPAAKIVAGIPFFGHGWTGVASVNHGLLQRSSKPAPPIPGDILFAPGHATWRALRKLAGFAAFNDHSAGAHWIYNARTRTFWSFDDQRLIMEKMRYIKKQRLAGAMIWAVKDDSPNASLVKAMAAALKGR